MNLPAYDIALYCPIDPHYNVLINNVCILKVFLLLITMQELIGAMEVLNEGH